MKIILFLILLTVIVESKIFTPIPANFSIYWYKQKVDHFNYNNNYYFNQRVLISTDHWCNDHCPIFFYAGNEGDIFTFANNTGFMWENAHRFQAMVIFAEHRYYGESLPFGNKSFENLDNLGYLTVEQALADYAALIQEIKLSYSAASKSPVIMFGGSYGGMLAAWFRIKYPHLVEGALAASAPILQFPGLYECNGYFNMISKDFRKYSESCYLSIKKSWDVIREMGTTQIGRRWLRKTFNLCTRLKSTDMDMFLTWISSTYEDLAMIDYPNPANFLAPLPAYPINVTCSYLKDANVDNKTLIENIYKAISVYNNYTGETTCYDFRDNSSSGRLGGNAWDFQSCTEMVLPICSTDKTSMFSYQEWDNSQVAEDCFKNFGVKPENKKAIMLFGGKDLMFSSNIIFSNGERDPWSAGGVKKNVSPTSVSILIPNACHHEDLRSSGPNDPIELHTARQTEINIIKYWINNYYTRIEYMPVQWRDNYNLI